MKKTAIVGLLALLSATSCTSLDIDGARLGASITDLRATAHSETSAGQRTTSTADTEPVGLSFELTNVIDRDSEVGLIFSAQQGDIGEVGYETYNIGASVRQFAGTGSIRPYIEGRIGYGYGLLTDPVQLGETSTDLLNLGASLGVEFGALFVQADLNGSYSNDDFRVEGPGATIGFVVRF